MKAISEQYSGNTSMSKYNNSANKSVGPNSLQNMQTAYNNYNSRNSSNEPQDLRHA